jgi:outer membrane protein assembly factor BamB
MDFHPPPHRPSRAKTVIVLVFAIAGASWLGTKAWWGYQSDLQFAVAEELADALEIHRSSQNGTIAPAAPTIEDSWTDYRGPRRDGIVNGPKLLDSWPGGSLKPLYRQPIGGGYAAFVIGRGLAFTIEQRRDQEAVSAYDLLTGKERWTHSWPAYFRERLGGDGPRATPTLTGPWLLAYGAEGDLVCLEADTGALQWRREVLRENGMENLPWAMSGSPLVHEGRVIVTTSGKGGAGVRAYRLTDGKPLWQSVHEQQGYSSPVAVSIAGRTQILILSGSALHGLAPETGAILWSLSWETSMQISVAQPLLAGDDRVFVSTGYGKGSVLLQVKGGPDEFAATELWTSLKMKNKFTTSVIHQGTIYGLDEGRIVALDLESGKRLWKARKYGHGQLLLADDKLIVLGDDGTLGLVRPSPKRYEEISAFQALEGRTWNNPAMAGGILLLRNDREMAAFDLRAP